LTSSSLFSYNGKLGALSTDEGISKLLSILRNLGVDDTLKEMGLEDGDMFFQFFHL